MNDEDLPLKKCHLRLSWKLVKKANAISPNAKSAFVWLSA